MAWFQIDVLNTRKLLKSPGFPAPTINLSQKSRRWSRSSIEAWVKEQEAKNNKGTKK